MVQTDPHSIKVRIYFEDTDAGGIVYHANYLKYMERGRTDWLRALGFEQDVLLKQNIAFVVKKLDIDYQRTARFNQELSVQTCVIWSKKASILFEQIITCSEAKTITCARVHVACINLTNGRPCRIPEPILKKIAL